VSTKVIWQQAALCLVIPHGGKSLTYGHLLMFKMAAVRHLQVLKNLKF